MKKIILTLSVAMLFMAFPIQGQERSGHRKFTAGLEWNYSAQLFNDFEYNYITVVGDRSHCMGSKFDYHTNGQLLGSLGCNLFGHSNISIYAGYAGLGNDNRVFPVSVRYTYAFSKRKSDGYLAYADGGIGVSNEKAHNYSRIFKSGGGYRIYIGNNANMDFMAGIQAAFTHPGIFDADTGREVTGSNFKKSDAWLYSISLGMSINF